MTASSWKMHSQNKGRKKPRHHCIPAIDQVSLHAINVTTNELSARGQPQCLSKPPNPSPNPPPLHFISKLPSLSFLDFKTYYETHHIPLFLSLVDGSKYIDSYILHYAPRTTASTHSDVSSGNSNAIIFTPPSGTETWEYDAIARIVYKSQEAYEEMLKKYEENYEVIAEDEGRFLDKGRLRALMVGKGESTEFVLE
ncbi:hypothetical protein DOTSEDRAFT_29252 [Dothistroma septosporum NZE10]|uniref:EthD domain-containing protein n=1 Tax=Dothistroma septosporum (strain NZE10 / CBS 128990) TaxID=675120 RepID=M2YJJ1_DOTSN|nr:hypothetical protein DOTSEDRAFT_29252 [Dothistroma septosporum NZE10]